MLQKTVAPRIMNFIFGTNWICYETARTKSKWKMCENVYLCNCMHVLSWGWVNDDRKCSNFQNSLIYLTFVQRNGKFWYLLWINSFIKHNYAQWTEKKKENCTLLYLRLAATLGNDCRFVLLPNATWNWVEIKCW